MPVTQMKKIKFYPNLRNMKKGQMKFTNNKREDFKMNFWNLRILHNVKNVMIINNNVMNVKKFQIYFKTFNHMILVIQMKKNH